MNENTIRHTLGLSNERLFLIEILNSMYNDNIRQMDSITSTLNNLTESNNRIRNMLYRLVNNNDSNIFSQNQNTDLRNQHTDLRSIYTPANTPQNREQNNANTSEQSSNFTQTYLNALNNIRNNTTSTNNIHTNTRNMNNTTDFVIDFITTIPSNNTSTTNPNRSDNYITNIANIFSEFIDNDNLTTGNNLNALSYILNLTMGRDTRTGLREPIQYIPTRECIETATRQVRYGDILNPVNQTCPITMEDFNENDNITMIRHCRHIFKTDVLMNWFRRNSCCPVCRYDIRNERPRNNNLNNNNLNNNNLNNNTITSNDSYTDSDSDSATSSYDENE